MTKNVGKNFLKCLICFSIFILYAQIRASKGNN